MDVDGFSALVADIYDAALDPPVWRKVLENVCEFVRGGPSASLFWQDALDEMINVQFSAVDRSDVTVSFTNPVPGSAVREIARLPGVLQVEAYRAVPVELRAGTHTYRTAITGLPAKPVLLTFDDGRLDSYRGADAPLQRMGMHAAMFVITGRIESGYLMPAFP